MYEPRHFPHLAERVHSQRDALPGLYGDVDFSVRPYRLALGADDPSTLPVWVGSRADILADDRVVELMTTATMLGDIVADAYAARMADESFKGLIQMLRQACSEGIGAVPGAPPELHRFIASMEDTPAWLDMELVEEGARLSRVPTALLSPYVTRGAFVATFMNTYAALPMALTGQLSSTKAATRVNETSSFFSVTTLPGALERHGPGFEAAAMVRLMHSMVRYNALQRSKQWDVDVYGIPIPQVDQMPAGLLNVYFVARKAMSDGRSEFTQAERAIAEFGRYRCFLLGLPADLLPETPEELIHVMHARAALLREDFDDDTCGELVRATMSAYLRPTRSFSDRLGDSVEKSYSKAFFIRGFANGDRKKAAQMGVNLGVGDMARIAVTAPLVIGRFVAVNAANRIPGLRSLTDNYVTGLIKKQLGNYGHPEFTSDHTAYSPSSGVTKPRPATAAA